MEATDVKKFIGQVVKITLNGGCTIDDARITHVDEHYGRVKFDTEEYLKGCPLNAIADIEAVQTAQ